MYNRTDEHHIFLYGGGIAFSLFTCIIPFVLIIFWLLGSIIGTADVKTQLDNAIYTIIPYPSYAEYVRKIVYARLQELMEYRDAAGLIGLIGLFFTASGLFSSLRTVLNHVFLVKTEKHAIIAKLRDFGMIFLLMSFFMVGAIILPIFEVIKSSALSLSMFNYLGIGLVEDILISVVSFLLIFTMFFIFYDFIPYENFDKKVPAVSALWAAALWEVARRVFGFYIAHIASLNKLYGAYVFIIVVAFWIYYTSILLILGAEIGQLYRERLEKIPPERNLYEKT